MLLCQLTARRLLVDIGAFGNADQGVMRFIHFCLREVDIVRRDQWQTHRIGHFDQRLFSPLLCLGQRSAFFGMALQLHIKSVGVDCRKARHQRLGRRGLPLLQKPPNRAIRPA